MSQSSVEECNAANDAANALLNGGEIRIKSGTATDIDSGPSGTLLETFSLPATAFGASSGRVASINSVAVITATSAGSAPYHYEAYDSSGNLRRSGTAGTNGTDMVLSAATWGIGDTLTINSWTRSQPK